jgi:predicted ATPase/signal transduction histidine kinase/tRNA A-37 threonylcarbamoyl transferase component Bud32
VLSSGGYTIVERFSQGSGTVLYRALTNPDHAEVILKVIDPKRHRAKDRERIRNEYEIGKSLDARLTVKPLAIDTFQGLPALVLPDLRTRSLDTLLGKPLETSRFLELAVRIAECVEAIHAQDIVHKDIKPANIFVEPGSSHVRIADFGLAARIGPQQEVERAPRLIEGSLPYISPEQTGRMNRGVDGRADLYSLGVTFYEMLTGRLPFQGRDPVEWVHCHVARKIVPLAEAAPSVPAPVAAIVTKLLAKMPEERYQTARGLRHDLTRCRDAWQAREAIEPFPLGEHDTSDRLQIPQTLYGRDAQLHTLLGAFERVIDGGEPELVLVSGHAGIGKTALVNELRKPVVRAKGIFASGKFDAYVREIPYATFGQAFQDVVLEILAQPEEQVVAWRRDILEALGVNARLIIDIVPDVELVIGPQAPVPRLSPAESENRFRRVVSRFIGVFARRQHPLTLFLDDLQWADPASLRLVFELVRHSTLRSLMIVGAYRDNEVGPAHPVARMSSRVRKARARVSEIVLSPLTLSDLTALVSDAFRSSSSDVAPLATLVHPKTGGNPFFAIQFLKALGEEHLIEFDRAREAWRWDVSKIRAKEFTDNVIDLMIEKIKRLSVRTQEALRDVAALGSDVEMRTLTIVRDSSEEEVDADLHDAVRSGLLLKQSDSTYQFLHDRVREAAYGLIAERDRPRRHLEMGRLLLAKLSPAEREQRLFDVVGQLNRGLELVGSAEERARICELDIRAGQRAKAAIAYASAREYLSCARRLLLEDAWEARYVETLGFYLDLAECEYLVGNFDPSDELFHFVLGRARQPRDRAKVYCRRMILDQLSGRYEDAVKSAAEGLRLLGVTIPESEDELRAATEAELRQIPIQLGGRRVADLVDAPEVDDPCVRALVSFLVNASAPAYVARPRWMPLLATKAINLSLRHGNQAESAQAYDFYAILLVSLFGDIPLALEFSEMSIRLNEKLGDRRMTGRLMIMNGTVLAWRRHFGVVSAYLERALAPLLEVGDLLWTTYLTFVSSWFSFEKGDPLDEVLAACRRWGAIAKETHDDVVATTVRVEEQFVACLQGRTRAPPSFDDATFDDAQASALLRDAGFATGAVLHDVAKLIAAFTYEHYEEALEAADRARPLLSQAMALPAEATYHFYLALTLTALGTDDARLDPLLAKLRHWADHAPENYRNRHALVSAEVARVRGRELDAERFYEEAIRSARENGFVHNEGLAYELAARFYRGRNFGQIADMYLWEARSCYGRWGADGKVRAIDRAYPRLLERVPLTVSPTLAVRSEQLDLLSVVKASQAVSRELVLDQLVRTLLRVLLEHSGARKGCLILPGDSDLSVVATAALREGTVVTELVSIPLESCILVPVSVIHYARLTKQWVILDDAAKDAGRFASDPYLSRRAPRSVLVLPILRQGNVLGVLYLENDLTAGAFTSERLAVLELLAAQSAISVENALLLAKEQAARAVAEEAERRAAFLDRVSAALSESLDIDETIHRLERVCVGEWADWCVIDVLPEGLQGRIVRLAGTHVDPSKQHLMEELERQYPPHWNSRHPSSQAIRAQKPMLLAEITDEAIAAAADDEGHARLIREIGTRTGVIVPLVARGVPFGALTLASGTRGRRYGTAELELAEEIARRAGTAIDNARLYRIAQDAVRMRDEFLSTASHELRTPITSLRLVVQSLARDAREGTHSVPMKMLDVVERQTRRLTALIDQLLDVARLETGRLPMSFEDFDIVAEVRHVISLMGPQIEQAHAPVTVHAEEPIAGRWDRGRVDQLFTNLLGNALTYGAGKPIDVTVRRSDRAHVEVLVRDRGIGIAADRLPLIFERFVRASSARHYGGLGLGLYIARQIVDAHHGSLSVESEVGQGSVFRVELPLEVSS